MYLSLYPNVGAAFLSAREVFLIEIRRISNWCYPEGFGTKSPIGSSRRRSGFSPGLSTTESNLGEALHE